MKNKDKWSRKKSLIGVFGEWWALSRDLSTRLGRRFPSSSFLSFAVQFLPAKVALARLLASSLRLKVLLLQLKKKTNMNDPPAVRRLEIPATQKTPYQSASLREIQCLLSFHLCLLTPFLPKQIIALVHCIVVSLLASPSIFIVMHITHEKEKSREIDRAIFRK